MSRYLKVAALITSINFLCACASTHLCPVVCGQMPFYNKYDTYSEMQEHLIILNKNIPEKKQFYFDFTLDGYKTDYYVAGIDMCYSLYLIDSCEEHDKYRCNYMDGREIYYELSKGDLIATLVFRNKMDFDLKDIYWTDEMLPFHGSFPNYEKNGKGDIFCYQNDKTEILILKFNVKNVDKAIVKTFQDAITKTVLENI